MTETEQAIKIIEGMSGFSTINVISLSIAGVAILLTLYQLVYKPNSLKAAVGQIMRVENYYNLPITFINSGYKSNAIIHATSTVFYENPIVKRSCKCFYLSQINAFTLKSHDVSTEFLKLDFNEFYQDDHMKNYNKDEKSRGLEAFLGIEFSIVTSSDKCIRTEYLLGRLNIHTENGEYSLKDFFLIGDVSINLLKGLNFANSKPISMERFKKLDIR